MSPYEEIELSHAQYEHIGTLLDEELQRIWNLLDKIWTRLRTLEDKEGR